MINRKATTAEVRKFYKDAGHIVRISNDEGHITYRKNGEGKWLEGRFVSEYRVDPQFGVVLN
jgi:hypothetical protein